MIIVKLQGGLGNQMFQYALGRNLSLIHNASLKIDYSYLKTPNQSGRVFQLDGFQIKTTEATEKEIKSYTGTFQKILDRFRPSSRKKHIKESFERFNPELLERSDGYFDGHWQNEKYFKDNEKIIRNDFILKNPLGTEAQKIAMKISSEESPVSLHIRRGDYVVIKKIADIHGTLPLSYYEKACGIIMEKAPDTHFFISSDDIAWAKENFPKKYPATFVSSPEIKAHEELALMSLCKYNIIANSTFGWWGAWLNKNPDKIVIAPTKWFNRPAQTFAEILPETWLKI